MASKRQRGDGSFSRLQDGRWLYRVSLGFDGSGRRQRARFYGRTQAECRAQAEDYKRDLRLGIDPDAGAESLKVYLEGWLEARKRVLRPGTIHVYRSAIETHITPALGDLALKEITRPHVTRFVSQMLAKQLAPSTVNTVKVVLGAALQDALRDGLVTQNVARLVRSVPEPESDVRPLSVQAVEALRDAVAGTRDDALYTVALGFGLRQGELLGLCWEDVDFERGLLHVRHTLQPGYVLGEPKTVSSRRSLVMPAFIAEALREQQARQQQELTGKSGWERWPNFVFREVNGWPINGQTLTRRFQALCVRLGIERHRFHDLRHTAATYLLLSGVEMKVIQVILGHATMAITADVYSHVLPQMQESAFEIMCQMLDSGRNGPARGPAEVRLVK